MVRFHVRPGWLTAAKAVKVFAALGIASAVVVACADEDLPSTKEEALTRALHHGASEAQRDFDYTSAAAHYRQLYERESSDIGALIGYGRNLRYASQPLESIKVLKAGTKKHGDDAAILLELAKAQLASAFINDSKETLAKVRALDPDNWDVQSFAGILHDRVGDHEQAQISYHQALNGSPGNPIILNNLALSFAQSGDLDKGIATLESVVQSENSTPQLRQNLSLLYALKGDFKRAEFLARQDLPEDMVKKNLATFRRFHE